MKHIYTLTIDGNILVQAKRLINAYRFLVNHAPDLKKPLLKSYSQITRDVNRTGYYMVTSPGFRNYLIKKYQIIDS